METALERVQSNVYFTFFQGVQSIQFVVAHRGDALADTIGLVNLRARGTPTGGALFTGFHVLTEQGFVLASFEIGKLIELVLDWLWQCPTFDLFEPRQVKGVRQLRADDCEETETICCSEEGQQRFDSHPSEQDCSP